MNLLNFKTVKRFIDFTVFCFSFFVHVQVKAWEVDMSRRQKELQSMRLPASILDENKKVADASGVSNTTATTVTNSSSSVVPSATTTSLQNGTPSMLPYSAPNASNTGVNSPANAASTTAGSITSTTKELLNQIVDVVTEGGGPTQDLVILNTENGFVPETIRLKKGNNYRIHVVNVNDKDKNVSFIMDAFSEQHATFFGQQKTFNLQPKTDGIFSYQCPETAKQGRVIIYSAEDVDNRKPASNK